jgi:hypothetical protein
MWRRYYTIDNKISGIKMNESNNVILASILYSCGGDEKKRSLHCKYGQCIDCNLMLNRSENNFKKREKYSSYSSNNLFFTKK